MFEKTINFVHSEVSLLLPMMHNIMLYGCCNSKKRGELGVVNGGSAHDRMEEKFFAIKVSFRLGEAENVNNLIGLFVQHFIMRNCNVTLVCS